MQHKGFFAGLLSYVAYQFLTQKKEPSFDYPLFSEDLSGSASNTGSTDMISSYSQNTAVQKHTSTPVSKNKPGKKQIAVNSQETKLTKPFGLVDRIITNEGTFYGRCLSSSINIMSISANEGAISIPISQIASFKSALYWMAHAYEITLINSTVIKQAYLTKPIVYVTELGSIHQFKHPQSLDRIEGVPNPDNALVNRLDQAKKQALKSIRQHNQTIANQRRLQIENDTDLQKKYADQNHKDYISNLESNFFEQFIWLTIFILLASGTIIAMLSIFIISKWIYVILFLLTCFILFWVLQKIDQPRLQKLHDANTRYSATIQHIKQDRIKKLRNISHGEFIYTPSIVPPPPPLPPNI